MKKLFVILGFMFTVVGCTSVHTQMNYEGIDQPRAEITGQSTYKFYPVKGQPYYGEVNRD